MGEEAKQEEAVKAVEEVKVEEESKDKAAAAAGAPLVLSVDLHCLGCAKKIEKILLRMRGVEAVVVDMATNQVTIKGLVEPHALCHKIKQRTKRRANVLSPLPAAEGQPTPQLVSSLVTELATVELSVDMHCEACAEQLKKKILKMRGVQTVATELGIGKVTVTGTMISDKLVDYVYRRTKKQARIVPQPEPQPKPELEPERQPKPEPEPDKKENKEQEKPVEEAKPDDKQGTTDKKEDEKPAEAEEAKKEEAEKSGGNNESNDIKDQTGDNEENSNIYSGNIEELEHMKKSIYYYYHGTTHRFILLKERHHHNSSVTKIQMLAAFPDRNLHLNTKTKRGGGGGNEG